MTRGNLNKLYLIFILVLMPVFRVSAQNTDVFPVECLSDSVLVEIKANYTAEIVYKMKYLFNQARVAEYSIIKVPINRHVEFTPIQVTTILADGREIDLDPDDIETISAFTPQYYPDSKNKIIYIPSPREGSRVNVSYKLKYNSLLYLPRFFRQRDIPTYNSYLEIVSRIPVTYYASETLGQAVGPDSEQVFYSANIPALKYEDHMPPGAGYQVVIKPDSVIYDGRIYGFNSWSDVALFYNELSRAESEIGTGDRIDALARDLVADAVDRPDSLSALLYFVRDNIRYVSVDIGRGEFKPLGALEVLDKKFGDCKDQSALLTAMCRAVGFKADPALMTTRDMPDAIISLPWPGFFNHVITAVDTGNGYRFLDASQATCCFGKLPPNLRNRRALICGSEPFMEFTLTSPFEAGNDVIIGQIYDIGKGGNIRVDVNLRIYRDPAFMFHSKSTARVLSDVLYAFFGDEILNKYSSGFKVENNSPDFIEVSGYYFESLPEAPKSHRLLVSPRSPYLKLLKSYFQTGGRIHPYNFDFTFNVNETVRLKLPDAYTAAQDSIVLSFNERGLQAKLEMTGDDSGLDISKSFRLFDYDLSADRYNLFNDFLLIASQISYNSVEIIIETKAREDNYFDPDSH